MPSCKHSVRVDVCRYGDDLDNLNYSLHACTVKWKEKGGAMKREHYRNTVGMVMNKNTSGQVKLINTASTFMMPETTEEIMKVAAANPLVVKLGLSVLEALKFCVDTPEPKV